MRLLVVVVSLVLSACDARSSGTVVSHPAVITPFVIQRGSGSNWTSFNANIVGDYQYIVAGRDGRLWYTNDHGVSRISLTGKIDRTFDVPNSCAITTMTVDHNGNFYTPDLCTGISQITPQGVVTTYRIGSDYSTFEDGLAPDRAGHIWFTETKHIGELNVKTGAITQFAYTNGETFNRGGAVTLGPDENIWFTTPDVTSISKIVPSNGRITNYQMDDPLCYPGALAAGPDGNIWFLCGDGLDYGKMTLQGAQTYYGIGWYALGGTEGVTVGPDGGIWFVIGEGGFGGPDLLEYQPTTNSETDYGGPKFSSVNITVGPDGNMWMTDEKTGAIEVYILTPISVIPNSLQFQNIGDANTLTVSEQGVSSWTAQTTNSAVATVAQGGNADEFVVTAASLGHCHILISDGHGNKFSVPVRVL